MDKNKHKSVCRSRRKTGIRKKVMGMPDRPRLSIFRSAKHMYGQVIDDLTGRTLVAASSRDKGADAGGGNVDAATKVGSLLASKAKDAGISQVVFDRNGFRYHGRVKAFADAAREGGLKF
jgi:large subunit ribosomal protein L18